MTEPQTLVFIQKTACNGGANNRLLDTLATLKKCTDSKLHLIGSETAEFTERCLALGVPITIHPLPEWRKFRERLGFARAIRALVGRLPFRRADWVVSNEMWWAPHAAALAGLLGARSAAILRDGIADVVKARKYRLQQNDLILPSSLKIARGLQADALLGKRTQVFLDAVFLPPRHPESAAILQEKLSRADASVRRWLLVLGRVQERKRQADAVRVLRGLLDRGHEDLGLIVAGDCEADYQPVMEAAIQECRVWGRVVMLGNFSDIQTLFDHSTACLLTSLREALPGSMMESCLAGRPCFMYPCEGAEDIFGPHQQLFVGDDFTPGPLIAKMDALLRDPVRLAAGATALQERARSLFSMQAHLTEMVEKLGVRPLPAS